MCCVYCCVWECVVYECSVDVYVDGVVDVNVGC